MADVRRLIVQEGIQAATAALLLVVAIVLMATTRCLWPGFLATIPLYAGMMRYSQRRLRPVFAAMEEAMALPIASDRLLKAWRR